MNSLDVSTQLQAASLGRPVEVWVCLVCCPSLSASPETVTVNFDVNIYAPGYSLSEETRSMSHKTN